MNDALPAILLLDQIRPNPDQPRTAFDETDLLTLSDSILEHGVLNPVAVKGPFGENGSTYYTLIDGERRCRAARLAGLEEIPALVHPIMDDGNNLLLAMIGNFQRSDMNPIEEGKAYQKLMQQGLTMAQISEQVNRSIPSIGLRLKILAMEPEIQNFYAQGWLPIDPGTIYMIANLPDDLRVRIASRLAARRATVSSIRQVCTRITNQRISNKTQRSFNVKVKSPAFEMGEAQQVKSLQLLSSSGDLPTLPALQDAAKKTCETCVLSEDASEAICKECPLVVFMKKLSQFSSVPV